MENENRVPVISGYTGQHPFRFWCQMALPLTYDDSLSYYELLNKLVAYVNQTVADVNALENYITERFDNLDNDIERVLDELASSGQLDEIMGPVVTYWLDYVTTRNFDAIIDGKINVENFQNMIEYAKEHGKNIHFKDDAIFEFNPDSVVATNPTRILFLGAENITVDGEDHTITMTGFGEEQLLDDRFIDPSMAGNELFSAITFMECRWCTVKNLRIVSDYHYDKSQGNDYYSYTRVLEGETVGPAREKGISIKGSKFCVVDRCEFVGLWGNGVLINGTGRTDTGRYTFGYYNTISNCRFEDMLENCANNMAGTAGIIYDNCRFFNANQGIETAGVPRGTNQVEKYYSTMVTNCFFLECELAVVLNHNDIVNACTFYESGLRANPGANCVLSSCVLRLSKWFQLTRRARCEITDCIFVPPIKWENSPINPNDQVPIYDIIHAVGEPDDLCELIIRGCRLELDATWQRTVGNETVDYTQKFCIYMVRCKPNISDCTVIASYTNALYLDGSGSEGVLNDTPVDHLLHASLWTVNNNAEVTTNKTDDIANNTSDSTKYPSTKGVADFAERKSYKTSNISTYPTSENYYPTTKGVYDFAEAKSNKITDIDANSASNTKYPTAKAVADYVAQHGGGGGGGTGDESTTNKTDEIWTNYDSATKYPNTKGIYDFYKDILAISAPTKITLASTDFSGSKYINAEDGHESGSTAANSSTKTIAIPEGVTKIRYTRMEITNSTTTGGLAFYGEGYPLEDPTSMPIQSFISGIKNVTGAAEAGIVEYTADVPPNAKYLRSSCLVAFQSDFYVILTNEIGIMIDDINKVINTNNP